MPTFSNTKKFYLLIICTLIIIILFNYYKKKLNKKIKPKITQNKTIKTTITPLTFHKLMIQSSSNRNMINNVFTISIYIINHSKQLLSKKINRKITSDMQLKLYGFYKQSLFGNTTDDQPSQLNIIQYSKWQAWNANQGISKMEAKKLYAQYVYNLMIEPYMEVIHFSFDLELLDGNENNLETNFDLEENESVSENESSDVFMDHPPSTKSLAFGAPLSKMMDDDSSYDENEIKTIFNIFDLNADVNDLFLDRIRRFVEENKVDINDVNENGCTFLAIAVDRQKHELCEMLLGEMKADPNIGDDEGYFPLHCASVVDNVEGVKLLLKYGARKDVCSVDNELPVDMTDSVEIRELLEGL